MPGKWAQKINPAKEVLSYYHTAFAPSSKIAIFLREFSRRWAGFAGCGHWLPREGKALPFRDGSAFHRGPWLCPRKVLAHPLYTLYRKPPSSPAKFPPPCRWKFNSFCAIIGILIGKRRGGGQTRPRALPTERVVNNNGTSIEGRRVLRRRFQ